jgi:hypothetical protein
MDNNFNNDPQMQNNDPQMQNIENTAPQKCPKIRFTTWMLGLIIIALLSLAAIVAPRFSSAQQTCNAPDPCEMAEMADQWLGCIDWGF